MAARLSLFSGKPLTKEGHDIAPMNIFSVTVEWKPVEN
jgi:hypothetical protein